MADRSGVFPSHPAALAGLSFVKILILGATGKTGTQLVDLALARGDEVTAFVRSPAKIARQHPSLHVVRGDPHDADELARVLPGHDVVLSALGVRPPTAFRRHTLVEDCARATADAMARAGVKRLVLLSAAVLFPLRGLRYAFFRFLLAHIKRDLEGAEAAVRRAPLEWTIARPPRLVGRPDERYRTAVDALPDHAHAMSFRAVAAFMLDASENRSYVHQIVGIAA
jgi:putative NADH-flavin reductase